jgi:hypothetical protein
MANIDDLSIPSLESQGLQLILTIRERRRFTPEKVREKKLPSEAMLNKLSDKQLADLYYTLAAKMQKELL